MKKSSKPSTSRATSRKSTTARTKKAEPAKARGSRDEMRAEYDFSGGVRGKYAKRYAEGTNIVVLEPDVAEAFPTGRAVNAALRRAIAARAK